MFTVFSVDSKDSSERSAEIRPRYVDSVVFNGDESVVAAGKGGEDECY